MGIMAFFFSVLFFYIYKVTDVPIATMAPASSLLALSGLAVSTVAVLYLFPRRRQSFVESYPPGPKSPDIPTLDAWVQYQEWGREYGDLVYIHENNMLILNNAHVANDLLDKRARIYSDRAMTNMMKLCGFDDLLSTQRYSDKWRGNRSLFQQNFRKSISSRFYQAQYKQIHQFLRNLTDNPEEFMQHTMLLSQGVIYASLYGLDIRSDESVAQRVGQTVHLIGRAIVEPFPAFERFSWLRFMPSWFPGCGFQKVANECLAGIKEAETIPYDRAVNNLKMGTGTSLIAELALESEGDPVGIGRVKAMGTISFLAGADTTMSSIASFLLTMTQHPDVQLKAQAEIDHVIGRDRLPTFEDRQSLPYVESIYREIMRMHPPVPVDLPHISTEDDFYRGYHIPKGCTIVANIWGINRDPNVFSEPDTFMPERFLNSSTGPYTNINNIYAFGFGRRVCAGRHMADNTVWLTIVSVLATLNLRKAKDDAGNEIDIPGEYTKTFFRHPSPYRSSITPRDQQARDLILATATAD
ncbi:cytochrome P450 1 [Rhodocollybia butyracea]|uniref:Cytochrome P450 1 n=1 Tax=Rhodocollybia butyracea TaxID=206335 RepID=A0A9P5PRA7_9AGAR|nr:cytochrome P450 1 [Rhodocollybia butyracea]